MHGKVTEIPTKCINNVSKMHEKCIPEPTRKYITKKSEKRKCRDSAGTMEMTPKVTKKNIEKSSTNQCPKNTRKYAKRDLKWSQHLCQNASKINAKNSYEKGHGKL